MKKGHPSLLKGPLREPNYGSLFRIHDVTDPNVVSYEGCDDTNYSSCLRDSIDGGKKEDETSVSIGWSNEGGLKLKLTCFVLIVNSATPKTRYVAESRTNRIV